MCSSGSWADDCFDGVCERALRFAFVFVAAGKHMGVCPQHDVLFDDLTVREHLQLFAGIKGVDKKEVWQHSIFGGQDGFYPSGWQ